MALLSLSHDLKLHLMRGMAPYDVEGLALTCRDMFSVAQVAMSERQYRLRNELRKRYHTVETGVGVPHSIPEFLCRIAADPEIAQHIVHLDLTNRIPLTHYGGEMEDSVKQNMEAGSSALRKLINESKHIAMVVNRPDLAQDVFEHITHEGADEEDKADVSLVFLLSLLPNLESLALCSQWATQTVLSEIDSKWRQPDADTPARFEHGVQDLVALLVERANDETLVGEPLSNLRVLHPMGDPDHQFGQNMMALVPFLALKSLREVHFTYGFFEKRDMQDGEPGFKVIEDGDHHDLGESENRSDDGLDNEDNDYHQSEHGDENSDNQGSEAEDAGDCGTEPEEDNDNDNDDDDNDNDEDDEDDEDDEEEYSSDYYDDNVDDDEIAERYQRLIGNRVVCRRYPVLGPNIEHIKLDQSNMSEWVCELVFRDMKRLKTLHFEYSMHDNYGYEWDIDSFLGALAYTVGPTLETLVLSAGHLNADSRLIRNRLHRFKVLKHLELNTVFFVNGIGSIGAELFWTPDPYLDSHNGPIRPLFKLLPPSLESFRLVVPASDLDTMTSLFKGFQEEREERLPLLGKVEVQVEMEDCFGGKFEDAEEKKVAICAFARENGFTIIDE